MPQEPPGLTSLTPVPCVDDVAVSLRRSRDVLGFQKRWQWSEDGFFDGDESPTLACVARGDHAIFPCERGRGQPGTSVCLNVRSLDDLDALHRAYVESGAGILEPSQDRTWGMRERIVQDPDGNTFRTGAVLPDVG